MTQSNQKILFQNKFSIPLCLSYENCKRSRRNHRPKYENCFAIFITISNFHISLQFSYRFAIITFWCILPMWTFTIFTWVCNIHMIFFYFHISLQLSRHDSSTSYTRGFRLIPCHYEFELINFKSATVLRGREKEKLELSKMDYYLLLKLP